MIKLNLEILDPHRTDAPKLRALAALFVALADGTPADQERAALDKGAPERVTATLEQYGRTKPLDPADNPAAGMPSPAEAFGAGNVVVGSGSALSLSPASTSAGLQLAQPGAAEGAALPDPAAVFSPNAAGGVIAGTPAPVPVSASIPPAPVPVPVAAAAPASPGVELDKDGLPWDPRIHSLGVGGTHPKKQDGCWKVKRGTGEVYLKQVQAELRAALNAGAGNVGGPATPSAAALPPPPPAGAPAGNVPAPAAGATPTPTASAATTNATGASSVTMAQLLPRVTAAMTSGVLTAETAAAIASQISGGQINNVAMLAVAPALIPAFAAQLDALGVPQ